MIIIRIIKYIDMLCDHGIKKTHPAYPNDDDEEEEEKKRKRRRRRRRSGSKLMIMTTTKYE